MHAIGGSPSRSSRPGYRLEILAGQRELTGSMNLGMAGENLLDQGRTGPRQPDDEHGPLRRRAPPRKPREEGRIE